MRVLDRETAFERLRAWLIRANPEAAAMPLEPDTDIIAPRILESLQVVEFILFIEAQTGQRVLTEDLNPKNLRTLNAIYESFFRPVTEKAGAW